MSTSLLAQYSRHVYSASEELDRLNGLSQFTRMHARLLLTCFEECQGNPTTGSLNISIQYYQSAIERFLGDQHQMRSLQRAAHLRLHFQQRTVVTVSKRSLTGIGGEELQLCSGLLRNRLEELEIKRLCNELTLYKTLHLPLLNSVNNLKDEISSLLKSSSSYDRNSHPSTIACILQTILLLGKLEKDLDSLLLTPRILKRKANL